MSNFTLSITNHESYYMRILLIMLMGLSFTKFVPDLTKALLKKQYDEKLTVTYLMSYLIKFGTRTGPDFG